MILLIFVPFAIVGLFLTFGIIYTILADSNYDNGIFIALTLGISFAAIGLSGIIEKIKTSTKSNFYTPNFLSIFFISCGLPFFVGGFVAITETKDLRWIVMIIIGLILLSIGILSLIGEIIENKKKKYLSKIGVIISVPIIEIIETNHDINHHRLYILKSEIKDKQTGKTIKIEKNIFRNDIQYLDKNNINHIKVRVDPNNYQCYSIEDFRK